MENKVVTGSLSMRKPTVILDGETKQAVKFNEGKSSFPDITASRL